MPQVGLGKDALNFCGVFKEPSHQKAFRVARHIKRLVLLFRSIRLIDVRLMGTCKKDGTDLRLRYMGEGESLTYYKNLCFSEDCDETTSFCSLPALRRLCARAGGGKPSFVFGGRTAGRQPLAETSLDEVVVVEVNRILERFLPGVGWLTFPWVRQKVDLKADCLQRSATIRARSAGKTRKFGQQIEISISEEVVRRFYREMYVPYIQARYGHEAHLRSLDEIRKTVKHGFLIRVFEKGQWISGAVCGLRGRQATLFAVGMVPDYRQHLRHGALSSIYLFLLQWAQRHGIESIDLLRSRPHGDDGVFNHKKAWGADIAEDGWTHTCIRIVLPAGCRLPSCLKRQLVRSGEGFAELKELWKA